MYALVIISHPKQLVNTCFIQSERFIKLTVSKMLPLKLLTYVKAIHCQNWYVTLICQRIITFFVPLKNVSSALNNTCL